MHTIDNVTENVTTYSFIRFPILLFLTEEYFFALNPLDMYLFKSSILPVRYGPLYLWTSTRLEDEAGLYGLTM